MKQKLTQEQIDNLYLVAIEEVQKVRYDNDFMNILSSLWHVYEKPSTGEDSRYTVLGDEILKHYVMNYDWPDDKLFISILGIKDDDERLLRFIQDLFNLIGNNLNKNSISEINKNLPANIELKKDVDGLYTFINKKETIHQPMRNYIKFVKCNCEFDYYNEKFYIKKNSIPADIQNNTFIISFSPWDDYGYKTSCVLLYKGKNGTLTEIGKLKIMKREEPNTDNILGNSFYNLSDDYCSLGQDVSYYEKMYELFKGESYTYLQALRDAAVFSRIQETFEQYPIFYTSLIRSNNAEKALREGRYIIQGRSRKDAYSFTYIYNPKYCIENEDASINVSFNFKYKCRPYERVYGLIGENGVGKTTLLNNILESLTNGEKKDFVDKLTPIFSKVMTISYSPFDSFPTTPKGSVVDYMYCGLLKSDNTILSKEEQYDRLKSSLNKINKRNSKDDTLCMDWVKIMQEIFPNNIIKTFCKETPFDDITLNVSNICEIYDKMSSGETIFLNAISDIIANIRQDTLLLFDEPEQHLHPHGIMQLIRAIYAILEKFESYAIIATHSPMVIREMLSSNVYIFNREDDCLDVAKIGIESFGEDIAILNDIVFKNRSEEKQYEKYIDILVDENDGDYSKVVSQLQNEHNELSLNTKLLIQSAIERMEGRQV